MSPKPNQESIAIFLRSMWDNIDYAVRGPLLLFETGRPRTRPDPFRLGQVKEIEATVAGKKVAARLRQLGLHEDSDFSGSFKILLEEIAISTVWSLLTALDGEGAFENETVFTLHDASGAEVSGYLHGEFFDHKPA